MAQQSPIIQSMNVGGGGGGGPHWANPNGSQQQFQQQQQQQFQPTTSQQHEEEFFAPLSTLDEPVIDTVMRDVRSVGSKLKVVLLPMERSVRSILFLVFIVKVHNTILSYGWVSL